MRLVTIPGAVAMLQAESLQIGESKLRRDAKAGRISSLKVGTRTLVDVDEVRALAYRADGIDIKALSREIGLPVSTIRRGIYDGWIPYRKAGKAYTFDLPDVLAAIDGRMNKQ